jgi:hypothetical protein
MVRPIDVSELPAQAQRVLGPNAPAPAKLMAARGVIPGLKPGEIVTVLVALQRDANPQVAQAAAGTVAKLPPPILDGALQSELRAEVVEALADAYSGNRDVVAVLLRQPQLDGDALTLLAERADEAIGELVATNEQRLLEFPDVIEKLYLNKRVRMSTADRLIELAVRNGLELGFAAFHEAAAAIKNELIPEPTEEPTFDDLLFRQADRIAAEVQKDGECEDSHEVDDEGEEKVKEKFVPLHAQIAQMTITQKIRTAQLGTSAGRMILIRDPNKLVAEAAAKSPLLRENEAAQISASRAVGENVLRIIAMNREFTRNYQVKINLVSNPRTPLTFSSRIIPHLRDNDLRNLARSKNVSGAIVKAVRQQLQRKQGKKKHQN